MVIKGDVARCALFTLFGFGGVAGALRYLAGNVLEDVLQISGFVRALIVCGIIALTVLGAIAETPDVVAIFLLIGCIRVVARHRMQELVCIGVRIIRIGARIRVGKDSDGVYRCTAVLHFFGSLNGGAGKLGVEIRLAAAGRGGYTVREEDNDLLCAIALGFQNLLRLR